MILRPLVLAPALLALHPLAAQPPAPPPPLAGTRLDVVATGEVARAPDLAIVSAGVVTEATTAGEAIAANARAIASAMAALRRAGVAERDIQTAALALQPRYRYAENQPPVLTGYQATNQLAVRFRDVKRAGAIIDTLVGQGINQISGPDFLVEQPAAALDEARTKALAAARARATLYARAAGLAVGRIVTISEASADVAPPPRPMVAMARMEAKQADTMIVPGEQKLGVTLNVTFELR